MLLPDRDSQLDNPPKHPTHSGKFEGSEALVLTDSVMATVSVPASKKSAAVRKAVVYVSPASVLRSLTSDAALPH